MDIKEADVEADAELDAELEASEVEVVVAVIVLEDAAVWVDVDSKKKIVNIIIYLYSLKD